jgi:hypothetical protein
MAICIASRVLTRARTATIARNGQEPPPIHSAVVFMGAGGGIDTTAGNSHQATTSFGHLAGYGKADSGHSVQLGVQADAVSH